MRADNKVSVVIPNYNGKRFLAACLKALLSDAPEAELLVVDNGSADGSRELAEREFPGARLIALDKNYGFPRAVNEGIRAASRPYVILLNNDTEVLPGFTDALADALEADGRAFSAQAKLISLQDPERIDDAGNYYCALGWAFARGKDRPAACYEKPGAVFAACAGAAAYRRELFEKIGSFDEAHFAYLEDIDVGWRARIAGYRNLYVPSAKVLHAGSGTSGSKYNSFKVKLAARNNVYLNYKNMPLFQLVLNALPIGLGMAVKFGFFKKIGFAKDYAEGVKEGFATAGKCRKVPFRWKNFFHYVGIEAELIWGTLLYVWEFGKRRVAAIRPIELFREIKRNFME